MGKTLERIRRDHRSSDEVHGRDQITGAIVKQRSDKFSSGGIAQKHVHRDPDISATAANMITFEAGEGNRRGDGGA
jgi:hypothetical protein